VINRHRTGEVRETGALETAECIAYSKRFGDEACTYGSQRLFSVRDHIVRPVSERFEFSDLLIIAFGPLQNGHASLAVIEERHQ
jgi:hypothetical protein